MKVAFVTDGTAYFPADLVRECSIMALKDARVEAKNRVRAKSKALSRTLERGRVRYTGSQTFASPRFAPTPMWKHMNCLPAPASS